MTVQQQIPSSIFVSVGILATYLLIRRPSTRVDIPRYSWLSKSEYAGHARVASSAHPRNKSDCCCKLAGGTEVGSWRLEARMPSRESSYLQIER
jgi:hypothetical protein